MTRPRPIPFGPDRKDPSWRWGAFLVGIAAFAALAWIATLGGIDLIGWWWIVSIVLGALFSIRSGRAWARGDGDDLDVTRTVAPTVDIRGQAGSTYLLLEPARVGRGARVRPRELSPFWWALYSLLVRAPVALGDHLLTIAWRLSGGFWSGDGVSGRLRGDQIDHAEHFPDPDRERF